MCRHSVTWHIRKSTPSELRPAMPFWLTPLPSEISLCSATKTPEQPEKLFHSCTRSGNNWCDALSVEIPNWVLANCRIGYKADNGKKTVAIVAIMRVKHRSPTDSSLSFRSFAFAASSASRCRGQMSGCQKRTRSTSADFRDQILVPCWGYTKNDLFDSY